MSAAITDGAGPPPLDMNEETVAFAVALFGALAHPTRLRIVELLTQEERTVNAVAEALGLLQPNASQHLAILHRAGVTKVTREGAQRCYSLRGPRIQQILRLVNEFRSLHVDSLKAAASTPEA